MNHFTIAFVVLAAALVLYAFRILREYERGVIFFLGSFLQSKRTGVNYSHSLCAADRPCQPAHGRDGCAEPGCYLAR
jgi:regulator of protease activity HflC (stomatin/prohibitin superfamily)